MRPLRRVGLFAFGVQPDHRNDLKVLAGMLERAGVRCAGVGSGTAALRAHAFPRLKRAASCGGMDGVLSLGGDGTLLGAVALAAPLGVPVLGINLGQLGFMTALNAAGLALELPGFLAGRGRIEERVMVRARQMRLGRVQRTALALNEIVLARASRAKLALIEASIDGLPLARFRADGLIVASPTGSTAYALAVGGPIIAPRSDVLLLAPIAPHTLSNRPLIVPGQSKLLLRASRRGSGLAYSADGGPPQALRDGESLYLDRAPEPAKLIFGASRDTWAVLRGKLGWQVPSYSEGRQGA